MSAPTSPRVRTALSPAYQVHLARVRERHDLLLAAVDDRWYAPWRRARRLRRIAALEGTLDGSGLPMVNHSEAQELHELIGAAIEAGDLRGLWRARELAALVVSDTESAQALTQVEFESDAAALGYAGVVGVSGRAAHAVARFGAIVLLLGIAACGGFIVGRATAPTPPRGCDAIPAAATRVGDKILVTQIC